MLRICKKATSQNTLGRKCLQVDDIAEEIAGVPRKKSAFSQHAFVYVGSSEIALLGCETKQSGDNLDEI